MKSLILASLFVPALAVAQPSADPTYAVIAPAPMPMPAPAQPKEKADSINFSPLGLLFGSYSLGYEHLFNGEHGVILEGNFAHQGGSDSSSTSLGGGVGYRWHWRGQQNSGFLGITAAQNFGSGEATIDSNNKMTKFKVGLSSTTLTANIGKRWMVTDALNITLRFGLGWAHYAVHADTTDMDAKAAEKKVNDLLALFPIGVDGELSVGYTF